MVQTLENVIDLPLTPVNGNLYSYCDYYYSQIFQMLQRFWVHAVFLL